jgi:hypothetical protein
MMADRDVEMFAPSRRKFHLDSRVSTGNCPQRDFAHDTATDGQYHDNVDVVVVVAVDPIGNRMMRVEAFGSIDSNCLPPCLRVR